MQIFLRLYANLRSEIFHLKFLEGMSSPVKLVECPRDAWQGLQVQIPAYIKTDYLKPLFKMTPGEYYGEKNIRKGLEKAREIYGTGGYYEFTGFPDYKFHDDPNPNVPDAPDALTTVPLRVAPSQVTTPPACEQVNPCAAGGDVSWADLKVVPAGSTSRILTLNVGSLPSFQTLTT